MIRLSAIFAGFGLTVLLLPPMALVAGAESAAVLPVEIVTVDAGPLGKTHRLVGTIEAANTHAASFRTGGRITEIAADVGDAVAAGEVIARVDDTQARGTEAASRAAVRAADAALKQAQQALDRARLLLERGIGTQSQLDEAEQIYETAMSARDQVRAQLARAVQALDDTAIRALEDSIVIDRLVSVGEVAGAGQTVFILASQGRREAVFQAPDLGELSAFRGRRFELSLPDGGQSFDATVTEVSPVLSMSGTVEVRALIAPSADDAPDFGDIVEGEVTIMGPPVVQVPWTALTATADGPAVWVLDPDSRQVALRRITVSSYTDMMVAVSGGLEKGELVVGAGSQDLYEGRVVAPAEVSP